MRIKNKRALKRRVYSNIREDSLVSYTYADISRKRGKRRKAHICGIGCLGLPHTIKERQEFFTSAVAINNYACVNENNLLANMRKEFGITPALALLLEVYFVAHRRRGVRNAENFLRGFVKHIPEGANVTENHIRAFCRRANIDTPQSYRQRDEERASFTIEEIEDDSELEAKTEKLFAWFDAGARVSRMNR